MTSSCLLNNIKIEIRSLLVSSPKGLSEDELCRDYSLFNSQRSLPYEIFGYSTKTDFLNSLTDILYRSSDGYIHPIVDQTTEHILKFVQQQRTNKKKKKALNSRNKQKKSVSSYHTSFQQMYPTVGAKNTSESKESLTRFKSINNESQTKFERIYLTNEFLQQLLIHFKQQKNISVN